MKYLFIKLTEPSLDSKLLRDGDARDREGEIIRRNKVVANEPAEECRKNKLEQIRRKLKFNYEIKFYSNSSKASGEEHNCTCSMIIIFIYLVCLTVF